MERLKSQFKVGDRIVCINDSYSVIEPKYMFMNFPKKGKTYTIRGFCFLGISMHLEEIKNQPLPGRDEIWFYNWHFRKRIILHKEEVEQSKKKAKPLVLAYNS